MITATVVFTGLMALVFLVAAVMKLTGHPRSLATRDRLGIGPGRWRAIGGLEIAGATGAVVGLAVPPLGIAATSGLVLLALGALGTHLRWRDPLSEAAPALVAVVLSVAALALQITTA